jgi:hypothetical protein
VKMRALGTGWAAATVLLVAACGSGPPAGTASRTGPGVTATPVVAATAAPPSPTPTLPAVPDFPVVAYQGDQAFGGHDGHFSAVFAAGRPVVLLYFAGL